MGVFLMEVDVLDTYYVMENKMAEGTSKKVRSCKL